jgi:hypothetical protein
LISPPLAGANVRIEPLEFGGAGSAARELSDTHGREANRQTGTEAGGGSSCVAREVGDDESRKVPSIEKVLGIENVAAGRSASRVVAAW